MAATAEESPEPSNEDKLISTYLGLSFTIYLALNRELAVKLRNAEEQLRQMRSHRKEDSKANARVVEIFASHRNAWHQEEKRLLQQIDESAEEIAHLRSKIAEWEQCEAELRARVEELKREVSEREEMLNFMSRKPEFEDFEESNESVDDCYPDGLSRFENIRVSEGLDPKPHFPEGVRNAEEDIDYGYGQRSAFNPEFLPSASKAWAETNASIWKGVQCESLESMYHMKHFVPRRESPWKIDGESSGISSKLKLLEQELFNLERVGKTDISKVPSMLRKQAKRYQALAGKIDDLCRRMQASDPCEPTLSSEFRTQRQTEFLLEAFRLQQRASETGQKLVALQTETGKNYIVGDELGGVSKSWTTRRSFDSIRNNFKEIQRNLEIWLARIIGDLEGILARDGASRVREYYISRYPFIQ